MKKLLVIAAVLFTFNAYSQNFQLHRDFERGHYTSTFEMFKPDKYGNTFTFVDFDYDGGDVSSAYYEIARVIKTKKMPVGLHLEYNGGTSNAFSFANAYILGLNYAKGNKTFGFSTYAGYKAFKGVDKANFQVTCTWYYNLFDGKVLFSGFADLWSEKGDAEALANFRVSNDDFVFLTEPQIWYNVNDNLSVGGEVEISNNFQQSHKSYVRPTLALKWNF
ncbi:MAG: DUF5020 family protein [Marinifilaceae bacterium]|jgi:hypothetical protein|nr:DUF5020 family protein [Marinifilaceae bacterium]